MKGDLYGNGVAVAYEAFDSWEDLDEPFQVLIFNMEMSEKAIRERKNQPTFSFYDWWFECQPKEKHVILAWKAWGHD